MPEVNKGIINTGTIGGNVNMSKHEKHIGDKISIKADHSVVNLKGRMDNISFNIKQSELLPDSQKQEFEDLMEQFKTMIQSIAEQEPEDTERITDYLEMLSKELNREKPQKGFIQSIWANIKQTAKVLSDSLPDVISLCGRVEKILVGLAL